MPSMLYIVFLLFTGLPDTHPHTLFAPFNFSFKLCTVDRAHNSVENLVFTKKIAILTQEWQQ